MIKIDDGLIDGVLKKSRQSSRKRANYNFHAAFDAPIQRMLNVAQPGTYVRPHKHENPDKIEVFVIIKGRALIVEFDEKGNTIDHFVLSPKEGNHAVEIPPRVWHSFIALEPDTALYEVKEGPYNKDNDKNFAVWAPEEGSETAQVFNEKILKSLKMAPKKPSCRAKIMGVIAAGFPSPAEEELADTMSLDEYLISNPQATYLLKVDGDSMLDAGIRPGDLVLVQKNLAPRSGDIVVAQVDGAWTLKYFYKKGSSVILRAANKKYPDISPKEELVIAGVVIADVRKYK